MSMRFCAAFAAAALLDGACGGDKPVELGAVNWLRGYEASRDVARSKDLPILLLFQEVPGCATCTGYGQRVLRHPLIVEAAETLFVPVAVFNNVEGEDKATLTAFKEPAWNNPVVRIVDVAGRALAPRLAEDYSMAGLVSALVTGLRGAGATPPLYLTNLAAESAAAKRGVETATFAMHCFWEGEVKLGALDGVLATIAGFLDGKEVVEVEFDTTVISFESLLAMARKFECATLIFTRTDQQHHIVAAAGIASKRSNDTVRPDKEPKYYLSRTPWRAVPMTPLQACRVNAALGAGRSPEEFLSPRQVELGRRVAKRSLSNSPNLIGAADLEQAWRTAMATPE